MMLLRKTWLASFVTGAIALAAIPARADTEGRIALTNGFSQMSGEDAVIDAAFLRIFVRSENIGGRKLAFLIDARSDIPLKNTPIRFNRYCDGDTTAGGTDDCRDGYSVRNVQMGQLRHLAGIYDMHVRFGENAPGQSSFSIGRKTVYEAGLVAIDGLVYEKTFDKVRVGGFGGLQPDPLTRMVSADYPTVGGYLAYQNRGRWHRFGATVQSYIGSEGDKTGLDRATIFNQNYFALGPGMNLATFAQFDAIPGPEERLIYLDLTYRPSGRYRVRLNVSRYRPVAFEISPQLRNGDFDPLDPLLAAFKGRADRPRYSRPEVLPDDLLTSAVTQAKVVGHYVTRNSITPYGSLQYRLRDIDSLSAIIATVGAYTYDPYSTGITARFRVQFEKGFDQDVIRLGGWLEREGFENIWFGGGAEAAQITYHPDPINVAYTPSATVYQLHGQARYERDRGIGFFIEGAYLNQVRTASNAEPGRTPADTFAPPPLSAAELSFFLGASYRF